MIFDEYFKFLFRNQFQNYDEITIDFDEITVFICNFPVIFEFVHLGAFEENKKKKKMISLKYRLDAICYRKQNCDCKDRGVFLLVEFSGTHTHTHKKTHCIA